MTKENLMTQAMAAMHHAYAPYSGFQVGAALLCKDGSVYCGCNIENASYGATICAERTALYQAIYHGQRGFAAIAVCGGKNGVIADLCPPCGICRQVLREFCDDAFQVYLTDGQGNISTYTLSQLLPHSFSTDSM